MTEHSIFMMLWLVSIYICGVFGFKNIKSIIKNNDVKGINVLVMGVSNLFAIWFLALSSLVGME